MYVSKESCRDGEMWVSVLVLGAAEHPVFSAAGAAVPLLPPVCDCQLPDIYHLSHSKVLRMVCMTSITQQSRGPWLILVPTVQGSELFTSPIAN